MEMACRLNHGKRRDALSEVTAYPHIEILASDDADRWKLKVLADHLRDFGAIPFSYKEMESTSGTLQTARLRVALHERPEGTTESSAKPSSTRPNPRT